MQEFHTGSSLARRVSSAVLAAVAVSALLVVGPAGTAQAACSSFKFNGLTNLMTTGEGVSFVSFDAHVPATVDVVGVEIRTTPGTAVGGISGRTVDVTVDTTFGTTMNFLGEVDDSGVVTGLASATAIRQTTFTSSGAPLVCADAATAGTATVLNDVDVYEVPDGAGTPYDGVFLTAGSQYQLVEPCRDSWCHLLTPGIGDGTSWVYQDGFLDVS